MVKIFGFFQFSKNHISETKLGRGLKNGIKIHQIGVYNFTKSRGSNLAHRPGVGTQNHDPKIRVLTLGGYISPVGGAIGLIFATQVDINPVSSGHTGYVQHSTV